MPEFWYAETSLHLTPGVLLLAAGVLCLWLHSLIPDGKTPEGPLREALWKAVFDNPAMAVCALDREGRIVVWNRAAELISGYSREAMLNSGLAWEWVFPDPRERKTALDQVRLMVEGSLEARDQRISIRSSRGEELILHCHLRRLTAPDDGFSGLCILAQDVTDHHKASTTLKEMEDTYRTVFENAVEGMFQFTSSGIPLRVNPAFSQMLGYSAGRELIENVGGKPSRFYFDQEQMEDMLAAIQDQGRINQFPVELRRREGGSLWAAVSALAVRDSRGEMVRIDGLAVDITRQKQREKELLKRATVDNLTGLANRYLFEETFLHALAQARRSQAMLALMYLDLDKFKEVNDTHGHQAGDMVLAQVASRLVSALRESDMAARMGGDEFTVLLWDINRPEEAAKVGEKLLVSLSRPYVVFDGVQVELSASIGTSVFPQDGRDPETLIQKADLAMYSVKRTGGNRVGKYSPALNGT